MRGEGYSNLKVKTRLLRAALFCYSWNKPEGVGGEYLQSGSIR